jgi:hypothetical protein
MESDHKEPKLKMSLEFDQEKPRKKKGLWRKLLDRIEELRKEEEERNRDPSDW